MELEELVKAVKVQDDINIIMLDIEQEKIMISQIFNYVIHHKLFNEDIIDVFYAEYYLYNRKSLDKSVSGLVNFIEDYYQNKDFLHNCFNKNEGIARTLTSNYIKNYNNGSNRNEYFLACDSEQRKIAETLSPVSNYFAFRDIADLTRYNLFAIASDNLDDFYTTVFYDNIPEINNPQLLLKVLISDAYTYMNLNNENAEFNDYIKYVENNSGSIENIIRLLIDNSQALNSFLIYMSNLFLMDVPYGEIYDIISKNNSKFMDTISEINPLIIMDDIKYYNVKRYRK